MHQKRIWILILLILLSDVGVIYSQTVENKMCTFSEVIEAYEAGQFRIIQTSNDNLIVSSDGTHISVFDDGVYRVADGTFLGSFQSAEFSPNSQYFAQEGEGIYRINDGQQILELESGEVSTGDGKIKTGAIDFSDDSQYISVSGYGVYRLNDGEQIITTDGLDFAFSSDSRYVVTTRGGIYRLNDGQKLFDIFGGYPDFSPDNNFVYAWTDGVYRVETGEKLFEIPSALSFTPNMRYVVAVSDGVYQLSDGQKIYDLIEGIGSLPDYSKNGDFMWLPTDGILYRIDNGEILFESHDVAFSPDGNKVAIGADGVYQLSEQNMEFSINGGAGNFSPDGSYLAASGDGLYRVEDGYKLIEIPFEATFSSDNMYVVGEGLGVYHIPTRQKLFDVEGLSFRFTDDSQYLIAFVDLGNAVIYRLSDGKLYSDLWVHDVSNGILSSAGTVMVVEN